MGNYLPSRLQNPEHASLQLEEYCKWKDEFLKDMRDVVLQSEVKMIGEQDVAAPEEVPAEEDVHYLDLPQLVVRERILDFVSNAQDMLNLLEAIPSEAKVCKLTKEELEFEVAFPEMLRTGAVSWTMERELRQLSFRSEHHKKVILKHFEKCLAKDSKCKSWVISKGERKFVVLPEEEQDEERERDFFDWREGEMSIEKWRQFPTTRRVVINWPAITLEVLEILTKFGEAAWDVELYFNMEDIRKALQALKLMSNVRNLLLIYDQESSEFLGPNAKELSAIKLPELNFLNFLKFNVNQPGLFWITILKKYGPKLKQLAFRTTFSVPEFPKGSMPSLDALTMANLRFEDFSHEEISSQVAIRFLPILKNSPLKVLQMNISERWGTYSLNNFYSLLEHIGNTVGNSLEHFEMEFGLFFFMDEFVDYNNMPPPPNVSFPKLKHFETRLDASSPDAWAFLCVFPALETLYINKFGLRPWGYWRRNVELVGISKELWRALPKLKWIQLSRQNVVTREQVLGTG